MKKINLVVLIFLCIQYSNGQQLEKLKLTSEGVTPVVVSLNNVDSEIAFTKAISWIDNVYDKPKEVLKESILNKFILIQAYKKKAWWYKSMGLKQYSNMLYKVAITFENNQFIFDYQVGQFYLEDDYKIPYDYTMFFKKDGATRPQYEDAVTSLEASMNNLLASFYSYVNGVEFPTEEIKITTKSISEKSYIDELKELAELKEKGIISESEFNELKAALIARLKKQ